MEKVQNLKALKEQLKRGRELNVVSSSFKILMVIGSMTSFHTEIHKQLLIVAGTRNRYIGNHRNRVEMEVFSGKLDNLFVIYESIKSQ